MLALAFSGGKDSLACWYLYRHEKPLVLWVNTGKAYPETLAIVDEVRAQSAFVEIKSDQQAQIDANGLPSDIVPVNCTALGMRFTGTKPVRVQSYLDCCYANIVSPLMREAKARGVTRLIRGQRNDEGHKSTGRHGDAVDGITLIQPIEDWSKDAVLSLILQRRGSVPDHFTIEHSSLDCYDCTAFLAHSADRVRWTKELHPALYARYATNLAALKSAVAPSMEALNA